MIANHHGLPGAASPSAVTSSPASSSPASSSPASSSPASFSSPSFSSSASSLAGRDHPVCDAHQDESARIVIVDDDPALRELLVEFLVGHGLRAEAVDSGASLRTRLGRSPCDLIVLDMMMPGEDGLSVLRTLTHSDDPPGVIMFSALADEVERVVALELGADDYVTKPSSPREILARIRSVLRRRGTGATTASASNPGPAGAGAGAGAGAETFAFAGWTLDLRMRALRAPDDTMVRLTDGEFHLLNVFVSEPQTVHSRIDMIVLSGRDDGLSRARTIDVNISRLRRKLLAADSTEIIRTVRGRGYAFMPAVVAF